MAALGSILFKRTINQFLDCDDLDSSKGKALTGKIKAAANDNLDTILETINYAQVPHSEILKIVCQDNIKEFSEKFFLDSLSHDKTVIRTSAGDILAQSKLVKPEKLYKHLNLPGAPCTEIINVLRARKTSLKPQDIITNALKLESTDALQLLKLADGSEHPIDLTKLSLQPEKIESTAVKINLLVYLSGVQQTEVAIHIIKFLSDTNTRVVLEALKSLSKLTVRFDVSLVLPLIAKMSEIEQDLVLEVVTNQVNPILIPKLARCFSGKSVPLHTALATIIADHANKNSFAAFLNKLETEDNWCREQTINVFLRLNNKNLFKVARELATDDSEFVRNSAQKIAGYQIDAGDLEKIGEFALSEDWQVRLRAIQTLGKSANRASVAVLKKVILVWPDASVAVLDAIKQLGYSKGLEIAFKCLDSSEIAVQRAALETIASIATEKHAKTACESITWKLANFGPEITALANLTIENLTPKDVESTVHLGSGDDISADLAYEERYSRIAKLENLKIGSVWFERYRILKEIGRGAMGLVLLVEDEIVEESLVLKFMHPELTVDKESRERFKREFKYTRTVSHASVIRVHDLFLKDDLCALSMEYFESQGLEVRLNKNDFYDSREGLEILLQVSSAMAAAHNKGVIHRDLKPSNILVNETSQVKIVDFGIAAATSGGDVALTQTGAIIGSPAYLAPERAEGKKADNRSDIYSMGIIAYYMFSGELPYQGKPMDILMQHRDGNAPLIHKINQKANQQIAKLIQKMMAVDPDERPQSMLEVLDEIKVLLSEL